MPAGLFCYGWSAQATAFWLIPDIGIFLFGCGFLASSQALSAYIIDAYPEQAASATAAAQLLRGIFAFAFPLFGPQLYKTLGYGWGNSLLGIAAVFVGLGGPAVMWRYGEDLRRRAVVVD